MPSFTAELKAFELSRIDFKFCEAHVLTVCLGGKGKSRPGLTPASTTSNNSKAVLHLHLY